MVTNDGWFSARKIKTECFVFRFPERISMNSLTGLIQAIQAQDETDTPDPTELCVFLMKHGIPFELSWQWCRKLTVKQNLAGRRSVKRIRLQLMSSMWYIRIMAGGRKDMCRAC